MSDAKKDIFSLYSKKIIQFTTFESRFIPKQDKIITVGRLRNKSGTIKVFDISPNDSGTNELKLSLEVEKASPYKCCTFCSVGGNTYLAVGDFDGRISVWDLERLDVPLWSGKDHINIINSLSSCLEQGSPEICAAGRDGNITVWDTRQKDKPVTRLKPDENCVVDCWSANFGNSYDQNRDICAGYDTGDMKLWDLKMNNMRWETQLDSGICSVNFNETYSPSKNINITTLNSKIYTLNFTDCSKQNSLKDLKYIEKTEDHNSTIWYSKQKQDYLITSSGIGSLSCYKKKNDDLQFLQNKDICSKPIIKFDIDEDKDLCVLTSLDDSIRILKLNL